MWSVHDKDYMSELRELSERIEVTNKAQKKIWGSICSSLIWSLS